MSYDDEPQPFDPIEIDPNDIDLSSGCVPGSNGQTARPEPRRRRFPRTLAALAAWIGTAPSSTAMRAAGFEVTIYVGRVWVWLTITGPTDTETWRIPRWLERRPLEELYPLVSLSADLTLIAAGGAAMIPDARRPLT